MKLRIGQREVADYHNGSDLAAHLSPRPYLHEVRTLSGYVFTQMRPTDHEHHLGVSNAIGEIGDSMFWGGKTYVHPTGYEMLTNHGRQVPTLSRATEHDIHEELEFLDSTGAHLLSEERHIGADLLPEHSAWVLSWRSTLHADAGPLRIGSPATRGRTGSGYGGLFWRVGDADVATTVCTAGGAEPYGAESEWLMLTREGRTLLLAQPPANRLPWFFRTSGYVGAGPAVAWQSERIVEAGDSLTLRLSGVLLDREIDAAEADRIYARLEFEE